MNADLSHLQATVAAFQMELDETRKRLGQLEQVVNITKGADGQVAVTIECTTLVVRPRDDPSQIAIELSSNDAGPFQAMYYPKADGMPMAVHLALQDGEPHIQLRGRDAKVRADTFIEKGRGVTVMFGADGAPGAVVRAVAGGGSVAVLQPDGRPRGVLVHMEPPAGLEALGAPTELIFANAEGQSVLKLRADDGGGIVSIGPPGQPDAAALVARGSGPALLLHSPGAENSVSIIAGEMAEVCVHQGKFSGGGAQACLSVGDFGSSMTLCKQDGAKSVEVSAFNMGSTVTLNDGGAQPCAVLSHHFGSHSSLSLHSAPEQEGFRALASTEVSSMEVKAPYDPGIKIVSAVHGEKPVTFIQKDNRALVMLGEGEQGGILCAYGPDADHAGMATLSGGPVTGALVMATADGTAQLTLDATDHGGRMMINNDLGFQRIAMGVFEEAAGIHLNHTGQLGVQAVATPKGGVVTVRDAEGHVMASLPDGEKPDDTASWGQSPRGF